MHMSGGWEQDRRERCLKQLRKNLYQHRMRQDASYSGCPQGGTCWGPEGPAGRIRKTGIQLGQRDRHADAGQRDDVVQVLIDGKVQSSLPTRT